METFTSEDVHKALMYIHRTGNMLCAKCAFDYTWGEPLRKHLETLEYIQYYGGKIKLTPDGFAQARSDGRDLQDY